MQQNIVFSDSVISNFQLSLSHFFSPLSRTTDVSNYLSFRLTPGIAVFDCKKKLSVPEITVLQPIIHSLLKLRMLLSDCVAIIVIIIIIKPIKQQVGMLHAWIKTTSIVINNNNYTWCAMTQRRNLPEQCWSVRGTWRFRSKTLWPFFFHFFF